MAAVDLSAATRLARLALPSIPGVNQLPGIRKAPASAFTPITVSSGPTPLARDGVERYAELCGFPRKDTVPITYPHMIVFTQHMELMARPDYPWPAMGGVHVENTIVQHRPIAVGAVVTATSTVGDSRPHPKGQLLDFTSTVTAGTETVWSSVSTYLVRGPGTEESPRGLDLGTAPVGPLTWSLPSDLGRRYGRVSGDINPIHLHPLSAKALGFPRQIAHGMWTKAHALAALENRIPEAATVEVVFKKPVFLPGRVAFGVEEDGTQLRFGLTAPRDGAPHLVGRITAL